MEDCHAASPAYCESLRPEYAFTRPRLKLRRRWLHRLEAGEPRAVEYQPSFVDGIGSKMVFPSMFESACKLLDGSLVVTLTEAAQAMKVVAERNRIIIEGAAACAVAAGLSGRAGAGKVVAIASGGNIDLDKFAQLVD